MNVPLSSQENKCLNDLSKRFDEAKHQIDASITRIAERGNKRQGERSAFATAQRSLAGVNYRTENSEDAASGKITRITDEARDNWLANLKAELDNLKARYARSKTGEEVNRAVAALGSKLTEIGKTKHFSKTFVLSQYLSFALEACESAESRDCRKALVNLGLPELPSPREPSGEDIPDAPEVYFQSQNPLPERDPWWLYLKEKKHTPGPITDHLDDLHADWQNELREKAKVWKEKFLNDHFVVYCEKRRKQYCLHFKEHLATFEASAKPEEEADIATEQLLTEMNEGLACLGLPLANAKASMKK